jgi:hypothetical protein
MIDSVMIEDIMGDLNLIYNKHVTITELDHGFMSYFRETQSEFLKYHNITITGFRFRSRVSIVYLLNKKKVTCGLVEFMEQFYTVSNLRMFRINDIIK